MSPAKKGFSALGSLCMGIAGLALILTGNSGIASIILITVGFVTLAVTASLKETPKIVS